MFTESQAAPTTPCNRKQSTDTKTMTGEVKQRKLNDPSLKTGSIVLPGPQPNINTSHTASKHGKNQLQAQMGADGGKRGSVWSDLAWRVFGTVIALAFAVRLYRLGSPDQVVYHHYCIY
jgi:hypothetical protein